MQNLQQTPFFKYMETFMTSFTEAEIHEWLTRNELDNLENGNDDINHRHIGIAMRELVCKMGEQQLENIYQQSAIADLN